MCSRAHIGMNNSLVMEPRGDGLGSRLTFKRMGVAMTRGFHCGSIYLKDGVGVEHETNMKLLHGTAARIALLQGPWVLAGDFNCTPLS